ncbi:plasmid partitioning protein RepB [Rhizobium alvei]|uniref:Plasmid partitioning protein RepB n=1 Tax=Rhizobium alvei TaxID=1132659 RepID=A0ABT8YQM6_9HYPH|nr:plasmid partitioning protein RepB [Rhizobium alvei]MDO6966015.1 plasmid partitioning protein RepB [Rhizobium alvei]
MNPRDRKNSIKALFGDALTPAPETKSELPAVNSSSDAANPGAASVPRAASGAVKAMGLSLSSIAREAEEARVLKQALEEGERIVSLDTTAIDISFISDRLSDAEKDDPDFLALVESIRDSGQHAPILVRPHPEQKGRYQVAYGHRRLKAARRLEIAVKAIVRPLTDDELVVAQGKENAERRNLSFIERALFAKALVGRQFDRKLIGEALAVQKSELSRLLQVADAVPDEFVRAIGPAPKAGRDRWMALGQLFDSQAARVKAIDEIHSERFRKSATDERFQLLFDRLTRKQQTEKAKPEDLTGPDGKVFARVQRQGRGVKIDFAANADSAFIESVAERLREDYARFVSGSSE